MEYKKGIFIEECKNRFIAVVEIDGKNVECYISSSSKLAPFADLKGKEVLLTENKGKGNRTKYTVHAVVNNNVVCLINLVYLNKLLYDQLAKDVNIRHLIYREKKINNNIKADVFVDSKTPIIYEVKGILSTKEMVVFPSIQASRAEKQLLEYRKLLKVGYNVKYCLLIMNQGIKEIHLNKEFKNYKRLFKSCVKNGMEICVYNIIFDNDGEFKLIKNQYMTILY